MTKQSLISAIALIGAIAVLIVFALAGWWIVIAVLLVASAVSAWLAVRSGLPVWGERSDEKPR